jgi:hypothetical protein
MTQRQGARPRTDLVQPFFFMFAIAEIGGGKQQAAGDVHTMARGHSW